MSIFNFVPNLKPSNNSPNYSPLLIQHYRAYINNTPLFIAAGYEFVADWNNNTISRLRHTNINDSKQCNTN